MDTHLWRALSCAQQITNGFAINVAKQKKRFSSLPLEVTFQDPSSIYNYKL